MFLEIYIAKKLTNTGMCTRKNTGMCTRKNYFNYVIFLNVEINLRNHFKCFNLYRCFEIVFKYNYFIGPPIY